MKKYRVLKAMFHGMTLWLPPSKVAIATLKSCMVSNSFGVSDFSVVFQPSSTDFGASILIDKFLELSLWISAQVAGVRRSPKPMETTSPLGDISPSYCIILLRTDWYRGVQSIQTTKTTFKSDARILQSYVPFFSPHAFYGGYCILTYEDVFH